MQDDTVDLGAGIGRIRWGDDGETVLGHYPGARPTKPRDGVDPATGRRISTPVGLLIKPLPSVGLAAAVGGLRQSGTLSGPPALELE